MGRNSGNLSIKPVESNHISSMASDARFIWPTEKAGSSQYQQLNGVVLSGQGVDLKRSEIITART